MALFLVGLLAACATSPLGRKQLMLVPDQQMDQMGAQAFQQIKSSEKIDRDSRTNAYVNCVVGPLTGAARGLTDASNWEVVVFQNDQANAFALPGGRIGVYTGLLKVAKTDAQLAAVVGHEIGHVIAKHGAERVSQQLGAQLGMDLVGALAKDSPHRDLILGSLGIGAQVGILLPFSRTQESEADLVGERLMADAGFDPAQSIELWKNMITASHGAAPPELISTHPASENRIRNLEAHLPETHSIYEMARAQGRRPVCAP